MQKKTIKAAITGVEGYTPDFVLTNADLEKMVDTSDEWIVTRTGIRERRILKQEQTGSSYMGVEAARRLLARTNTDPAAIDLVIVATVTPDYVHYPGTSNIVSKAIGATNAFAFDLQAGCSSFMFSVNTAAMYIENGMYRKVMVVGVDKMSSLVDYTDRETCVLFGDGAGAILMEPDTEGYGVLDAYLRSDGEGVNYLKVPAGGSLQPASIETVQNKQHYMFQNGVPVYKFAVSKMAEAGRCILERNGLSVQDIDWVVTHQANKRIIQATAERLALPEEKLMFTIHKYGNTSNASMPLSLWEYEGKIKKGDLVLFIAFGGGFAWGSLLLKWAYAPINQK